MQTYVFTSLSSGRMGTSAGKVIWAFASLGRGSAGPTVGVLRVMNLNGGLVDGSTQEYVPHEGPTVNLSLYLVCVCASAHMHAGVCMCPHMPWCKHMGQRTTLGSEFSLSTIWVLGLKLWLSGLVAEH